MKIAGLCSNHETGKADQISMRVLENKLKSLSATGPVKSQILFIYKGVVKLFIFLFLKEYYNSKTY